MPNMPRSVVFIGLALATSVLTGCGGGEKVATERFIYTTSEDCSAGGKISATDCDKAIDQALVELDKVAIKYPTLADCDKAEGIERCERIGDRHYRPRLMAFLFTTNSKTTAIPLFAVPVVAGRNAMVFHDANCTNYDWERTEGISFSKQAIRKAEGFQPSKKKG